MFQLPRNFRFDQKPRATTFVVSKVLLDFLERDFSIQFGIECYKYRFFRKIGGSLANCGHADFVRGCVNYPTPNTEKSACPPVCYITDLGFGTKTF
jgi:hypothetical protein